MSFEIVPDGTHIDFIGKRRLCAFISGALILISLIAIPLRGVRLGIDFAGGNEVQIRFEDGVAVDEGRIRAALGEVPEVQDPSVVRFGTGAGASQEFLIHFKGAEELEADSTGSGGDSIATETEGIPDRVVILSKALRESIGPLTVQRVEFVGPRVGEELKVDGLLSLFWASVAILIYVAFRFSSRYAPGAVVALIHDLSITAGIFVLLGLEFDLRVLAAMLAILGYSLNDTIIIYDRIRENMEVHTKRALPEVLNESVNQTLSRTVLTSGTTLAALFALYFLGGDVIRPFAFAMLIGVVVGTYSSIYIAAPLLLILEQRLERGASKSKKKPSASAASSSRADHAKSTQPRPKGRARSKPRAKARGRR